MMKTVKRYGKAVAALGGGIATGSVIVTLADAMAVLPPDTPWWGKGLVVIALGVGPSIVTALSPKNGI